MFTKDSLSCPPPGAKLESFLGGGGDTNFGLIYRVKLLYGVGQEQTGLF